MKNRTVPLPLAAAAVLITGVVVSIATKPAIHDRYLSRTNGVVLSLLPMGGC
jgi:hypothetical protein